MTASVTANAKAEQGGMGCALRRWREGTSGLHIALPGGLSSLLRPWVRRRVREYLHSPEAKGVKYVTFEYQTKHGKREVCVMGPMPYRKTRDGRTIWRDPVRQAEWLRENGDER